MCAAILTRAATDNCLALIRAHYQGITFGSMNGENSCLQDPLLLRRILYTTHVGAVWEPHVSSPTTCAMHPGKGPGGGAALPLYFIFGQKLRPTWLRQFDTSLSHFFFKASSPLTSRSGSAIALVPIIISFCALYSHIINRHKGPQCNSSRELKNSYLLYSGTCLVPVSLGPGLTVSAQISKLYCIPPRTSKLYIKV